MPRILLLPLFVMSLGVIQDSNLAGQHTNHAAADGHPLEVHWGAQGIGLVTHAAPAVFGTDLTEAYLTQPVLMGSVAYRERVWLEGMLNFEGLTLRRGELNAGTWGEGYVDRRHPHTYLHEVMGTVALAGNASAGRHLTISFGKGFVPFGTDDPMVRPFVKYPANHHLAQVLERLVATVAYREGPVILEAALFNGDEPASPRGFANASRFADSWAARLTLLPWSGVEASVSRAEVASPEFPGGSGLDHRKWSAAFRVERRDARGDSRYALAEWARTDEYSAGRRSFRFHSALVEAAADRGPARLALRLERTIRPEEERLLDPFRSPRPHGDANILGSTRWWIGTARADYRLGSAGPLAVTPFAELSRLHARETTQPTVFVPSEFYGSEWMWSVSVGVRLDAGRRHARMGRYGAARPASADGAFHDSGSGAEHPFAAPPLSHHPLPDR